MMLYIAATPIGNTQDASPRLRHVLATVDFILSEDTRKTKGLLHRLGITAPPLISCNGHNERTRINRALDEIDRGKVGALVSDAGTPAVSDPGMYIVEEAHKRGISVVPVPGPSSVLTAVSVAGFATPPMHFLGFPPRKNGKRRHWIQQMSTLSGCVVMFEAGNRFGRLISDLQDLMPQREMCLCRELTKTHQEIVRQKISDFAPENLLGEVTMVIGPGEACRVEEKVDIGIKSVAELLGKEWGITKREAYNLLMRVKPNS